jgi:vacuolar-type H+-ATPase subunit H
LSDVIDRLLQVEQDARRTIAEAEEEAERMVAEAREDARHMEAEGREAARQEAEAMREVSGRKLKEAAEARVAEERAKLESAGTVRPEKLDEAARFAADIIAGRSSEDE